MFNWETLLDILKWMYINIWVIGIILVFLGAIIGTYLSRRLHDRCLKHFEHLKVELRLLDGTVYSGVLDAENNGMEIDPDRFFYLEEYNKIKMIIYSHVNFNTRVRPFKSLYYRKVIRPIYNFISAIKDAIIQVLTILMNQIRSVRPKDKALDAHGNTVVKMGGNVFQEAFKCSYNPLLEKAIGKRVLIQSSNESVSDVIGVIGEYSKEFLLVEDADVDGEVVDAILPRAIFTIRSHK